MTSLSYNSIRLLIVFALAGQFSLAISKDDNFKEKTPSVQKFVNNGTLKEKCGLRVTPLQYEISIEPFVFPKGNESAGNSPENGVVSAWAKIRVLVNPESNCTNATSYTFRLNTRGCKIDVDKAQITHQRTGLPLTILNLSVHKSKQSDDDFGACQEFIQIQIEDPIEFGAQLEVYLPYTLETTREYYENSWQGLYYYQKRPKEEFQRSWEIYQHFPQHAQLIFPTFENERNDSSSDSEQNPTFKIHVARNEADGFITISNSDIQNTTRLSGKEGWVVDHFQETPPMAIDQVTVMILQGFRNHTVYSSNGKDNSSKSINLWIFDEGAYLNKNVTSDSINLTANYILSHFQFFQQKFIRTEYPLNKLDFILVPWNNHLDLHANLGIVANVALEDLFDESEKGVPPAWLTFDIAYQWLGGMVTVSKESLLPGSRAVGLIQHVAKWPFLENATSSSTIRNYLHPNRDNIETALLEMLQQIFSLKVMESAISDFYLPKMVWKRASPEDFYDSLQQSIQFHNMTHLLPETGSGKDPITMGDIYKSWRDRSDHFPLINVDTVVAENNVSMVSLSQQNFHQKNNNISETLWWLPVKTLGQSGHSNLIWLSGNKRNASFELENGSGNEWLILNPDGTGYYRVDYSASMLKRIIAQLKENHTAIPAAARNYLIGNQCKLANAKTVQWNDNVRGALELIKYLGNEMSWDVWNDNLYNIVEMLKRLSDKDGDEELGSFPKRYLGRLMSSALEEIGLTPDPVDDENTKLLREKLMSYCATVEIPVCMSFASQIMTEWRLIPEINPFEVRNISYDLREQLYCAAVIGDDEVDTSADNPSFRFLLQLLINGDKDYWRISRGLTCTTNDRLLSELLQNNTRLANGPEYLRNIFLDTIPNEILRRRPRTMTQAVYEFWMGKMVSGTVSPATFMRYCWMLIPSNTLSPAFKDKMVQFLEDNKALFDDDLTDNVANFKVSIKFESDKVYSVNENGTVWRKQIANWFRQNAF